MDRDTVAKTAQNCNMKKDGAKLAQEQSAHLFLCLLIHVRPPAPSSLSPAAAAC